MGDEPGIAIRSNRHRHSGIAHQVDGRFLRVSRRKVERTG